MVNQDGRRVCDWAACQRLAAWQARKTGVGIVADYCGVHLAEQISEIELSEIVKLKAPFPKVTAQES